MTSGIWGVCSGLDTGSNESGHKPTKTAAMLTQKNAATFDQQTQTRLMETHLLSLATAEIEGRPLWHYLQGYDNKLRHPQNVRDTWTGAKFECQFHEDTRIIASKVCQKQYTTMACILRQHSSICGRPARFIGLCRKAYHTVRARA
jgi:hypothetical protein